MTTIIPRQQQHQQPSEDLKQKFSCLKFYSDKTIFITGVTGFIGKVLLEKLLREFPSLKKIYVLVREKKSQTPQQRLTHILSNSPLFESHRDKFNRIEAISGDVTVENLGISQQDRQKLINEVNIVFHSAATVVFVGQLKKFIDQNVDGTDSIMQLCKEMIDLKSVVYVSTAYSNCQLKEIEEKVYPVVEDQDFESYLRYLRQNFNNQELPIGHPVLGGRPNPYTLSKAIAEWMIQERYSSLPIIICRPAIVGNSNREPMPGWCDSFSGLANAFICVYLGIARTLIFEPKCKIIGFPVDMTANGLIVAGAYLASPLYREERKVIHLVNVTNPVTWQDSMDAFDSVAEDLPLMKAVRPISIVPNRYKTFKDKLQFKVSSVLSHYLFGYMFDLICVIMGHKPFMLKIIKRMQSGAYVLQPFSCNEWDMHYKNNDFLRNCLEDDERSLFDTDITLIKWEKYLYDFVLGTRRYLMKDPDITIEKAKRRYYRLKIIFLFIHTIFYSLCYFLLKYFFGFGFSINLLDLLIIGLILAKFDLIKN